MYEYDPQIPPDPQEWLALDESERLSAVTEYHRRARIGLPRARRRAHAAMHTVVENQVAMGDEIPVKRKLDQLIEEGLDLHTAVHAIASVLIGRLWEHSRGEEPGRVDLNQDYLAELEKLTVESWRRDSGPDN